MRVELFLKFPDRATMLAVASALSGVPDVQTPSVDGWLDGVYWNLDEIGIMYDTTDPDNPVPLDGYHVNGLWNSDTTPVPEALEQFRIYPTTPYRRFG